MARSRKQELSPSSYPSARLIAWLRQRSDLIRHYKRQIALGGVVAAVCAVSGISWAVWAQYRSNQGLAHFRAGLLAIESEEYEVALAELARAERVLDGERRGVVALHLGEVFERRRQPAAARAAYERVVAFRDVGPYVQQLAFLRLGRGAEEAGELAAAAQWYGDASRLDGPGKSEALLAWGGALERQGEGTVPQAYVDLLAQFPHSPLSEVVRAKTGP